MSDITIDARGLGALDPVDGRGPFANEDDTVWAALDGEIYNRSRLQRLLVDRDHRLATGSDAELLAHLYEEYGDDLVYALEGAFALAIWDQRERRLLLARDRFGEKSLFYAKGPADELSFSFASTAPAPGGRAAELDPLAVEQFFVHGHVPDGMSIFADAGRLAPGHLLVWRPGEEPAARRYWELPRAIATDAETPSDVVREFGRLLTAAVRSRLSGDEPIGVPLDGGLDSTLIAAIAARESGEPVKTFTVAYAGGDSEALEGIRETARELGSEHQEMVISTDEIVAGAPDFLGALDQPLADPFFPVARTIAGFARGEVPVALGGEGAAELFGAPVSAAARPTDGGAIYGPRLTGEQPRPPDRAEGPSGLLGRALVSAERAGDQVSLGIRLPYLDYELAEFAATVASPAGAGGGNLVRGMLAGLVSKGSLRRRRVTLNPPTADWLRGPLGSALREQTNGRAVTEGWLDATALGRLIEQHEKGTDHSAVLWPALSFGLWLDRIREGDSGS